MASPTARPAGQKEQEHWDNAKEAGKEALNKGKEAGQQALESAKDLGADALGKVKEAGAQAVDKAKEAMHSVGDMATETATAVGKKADDMTAAAGHGIASFGETIAEKAPHDGLTGRASQAVATGIKESGKYIEDHKLSGMANDVEQVIKNHPIPTILVALGLGFCLGRAMRD
jgi:ElaB/YqjD/DUF883 family membrane-anchored ribosome-binding protein